MPGHDLVALWEAHCRHICAGLSIPLEVIRVDARPRRGQSPEALARAVRYAAFKDLLGKQDCLLMAHQQDDQAESCMYQSVWSPSG